QIPIVARRRFARAIGAARVQAVVALAGIKAAFGYAHADNGLRIDAEALHAFFIRGHVGLPDEHGLDAERTKIITHGHLADLERDAVPVRAVRLHIAAGVEAHARRPANRRLHVGAREAHAACRQAIDMWS